MQFGILGHDAPELTAIDWIDGDGGTAAPRFDWVSTRVRCGFFSPFRHGVPVVIRRAFLR